MEKEEKLELSEEYKKDIGTIANVVGFEIYKDTPGSEISINDDGIKQIWIDDEQSIKVQRVALRVLREMIVLGWSKANISGCNCNGNCNKSLFS